MKIISNLVAMSRKIALVICFVLSLFFCNANTFNLELNSVFNEHDIPDGNELIELNGLLDNNQGPKDVEAYTDQMNVYVVFHRSFGLVNITLYNEFWMSLYSDVVNTSVQQTVVIPITGTSEGVYTLVLENANGYAEGDYVKEP